MNEAVLSSETLKEKIGQMLIVGFPGTTLSAQDKITQAILHQQVGGVILFDYHFLTKTYDHNIKNPTQLRELTSQLKNYAQQAPKKIPLFIGVDYEGGKVNRLKEKYGFPSTLSAAEIGRRSYEEVERYAKQMAKTLLDAGINLNFAPVLDVNVNPDNPVIAQFERSFSADPKQVASYAAIFAKAYQEQNILHAYKHFPGHGSSTNDSHEHLVDVSDTWKKIELAPYQQLLTADAFCSMVMCAHVIHKGLDSNGYPASLSRQMINDLLRKKLNYQGLVVTDDLQMKAIKDHYSLKETIRLAINAGADLLIFGNQWASVPDEPQVIVETIYEEVMRGNIPQSRIDESYSRIKQTKKHCLATQISEERI